MHPLAVAAGLNKVGTFEIGEMAGDLRIIRAERLGEEADAHLAVAHQIQKAQPGAVREGGEKKLEIYSVLPTHKKNCIT